MTGMKTQKIDNAYVREIIRSLMRGIVIFLFSIGIIVSGDRERLFSLLITNQLPFNEIFAIFTFLFSSVYIWYYTCKGARIMRRRLQIWIGYTRAVVLTTFVIMAHQYF